MIVAQITFSWVNAISSLVAGSLGGLGTVYGLSKWLGNLIIERRKAEYAKELEGVRDDYGWWPTSVYVCHRRCPTSARCWQMWVLVVGFPSSGLSTPSRS